MQCKYTVPIDNCLLVLSCDFLKIRNILAIYAKDLTLPLLHNFFCINCASYKIHEPTKEKGAAMGQHNFVSLFFIMAEEYCTGHSWKRCKDSNCPKATTKILC